MNFEFIMIYNLISVNFEAPIKAMDENLCKRNLVQIIMIPLHKNLFAQILHFLSYAVLKHFGTFEFPNFFFRQTVIAALLAINVL